MSAYPTTTRPVILNASRMTAGMARYWNRLAERLTGNVDIIDPWRSNLRELRSRHPELKGRKIYRASTGGTHGKSAQITVL